jgi:hypothetical protein
MARCPRCEQEPNRDCLFGRCFKPVEGDPTIRDLTPISAESTGARPGRSQPKPPKETP